MEKHAKAYTVRQLAKMAGVSVRTLHHYDQIGLLKPSFRTEAGYRLYAEKDLLRLQQVLFYRELDFPLDEIRIILDLPGFDQVEALRDHRRMLGERAERLARLLRTVDRTIARLTEEDTMPLTDEELYEGFSPKEKEQLKEYEAEARDRWGEMAAESQRRVRQMSKAQWQAVQDEGDAATRLMGEYISRWQKVRATFIRQPPR